MQYVDSPRSGSVTRPHQWKQFEEAEHHDQPDKFTYWQGPQPTEHPHQSSQPYRQATTPRFSQYQYQASRDVPSTDLYDESIFHSDGSNGQDEDLLPLYSDFEIPTNATDSNLQEDMGGDYGFAYNRSHSRHPANGYLSVRKEQEQIQPLQEASPYFQPIQKQPNRYPCSSPFPSNMDTKLQESHFYEGENYRQQSSPKTVSKGRFTFVKKNGDTAPVAVVRPRAQQLANFASNAFTCSNQPPDQGSPDYAEPYKQQPQPVAKSRITRDNVDGFPCGTTQPSISNHATLPSYQFGRNNGSKTSGFAWSQESLRRPDKRSSVPTATKSVNPQNKENHPNGRQTQSAAPAPVQAHSYG